VERKKRERYSTEFKQQAVERMNACDNITRLSRELGVARHLLYYWRDRWLYFHRYLVCTTDLNSSVVLSIVVNATDAIVYGNSLKEYLEKEFLGDSI
jgi:transposase-like protein